jgi:hypothetical protein
MRSSSLFMIGMLMITIATPASAARTINLQCMQLAVVQRETSLLSADETYYNSVRTAKIARKDALNIAWTITDKNQRKTAIKHAEDNFRNAERIARKAFKDLEKQIKSSFKTQSKTCES